jgi:hypothetical protein
MATPPPERSAGLGRPAVVRVGLVAILLLAAAVRLFMARLAFASTFDTSTPALMALNILKGERPLFYYGQNYFGAIEAYLNALFVAGWGPALVVVCLAPTLSTLAWAVASYLLFRELFNTRAGLCAALVIALPGWDMLWYTMAPYGGYPLAFFLGTLALWLALRIAHSPGAGGGRLVALGAVAGLALWTHYSTAAYLLTALLVWAPHAWRHRRRPALWIAGGVGGLLFVLAVSPVLVSFGRYGGGHVARLNPEIAFIAGTIRVFWRRTMPSLLFWPLDTPWLIQAAVVAVLVIAALLAAATLIRVRPLSPIRKGWVPVVFIAIYLAMYLPHSLAPTGATRYVIPLAAMLLGVLFAAPLCHPAPAVRRLAAGLLAGWAAYHGVAAVLTGLDRAPRTAKLIEQRRQLAQEAIDSGADAVWMVGGPIFGHDGQTFGYYSGARLPFVSVFDERHQPSAQFAETCDRPAIACETPKLSRVLAGLDAVGVGYRAIEMPGVSLISDLQVPVAARRALPPAAMKIHRLDSGDAAAALLDRNLDTVVAGPCGPDAGVQVELEREIRLDSLWLFAPDYYQFGLPEGYRIEVSTDGVAYRVLREVESQMAGCYTWGNQVYYKGYFSKMECRFAGEPARFVRIHMTRPQVRQEGWKLSELYLFEVRPVPETDRADEATSLADRFQAGSSSFAISERWLSAWWLSRVARSSAGWPAYPRFNPKFTFTRMSRAVTPRAGWVLVAPLEVADDCVAVLERRYGPSAIGARSDGDWYSWIELADPGPGGRSDSRLFWNGHVLLESSQPEGKWY